MADAAILCLAINLYFEARNQPLEGQIAVTQVVVNRVLDERYPNEPCKVIMQGPTYPNSNLPIKYKCQFSWYCDGRPDHPEDLDAFRWSLEVSRRVWEGEVVDSTYGATHYHSTRVMPDWAYRAHHTVTVGDHIFYRWEHD